MNEDMELAPDLGAPRETTELRSLHPKIRSVWRFGSVISGLVFGSLFGVVSIPFAKLSDGPILFVGAVAFILAFCLFGGIGILLADKQFDRWRYQLREFDVVIHKGLFWRSERYIARDRIQHIDINAGPIDRRFGLVQLVIYAAGIAGSVGLVPGLSPEDAEWLKEQLLTTRTMDA